MLIIVEFLISDLEKLVILTIIGWLKYVSIFLSRGLLFGKKERFGEIFDFIEKRITGKIFFGNFFA